MTPDVYKYHLNWRTKQHFLAHLCNQLYAEGRMNFLVNRELYLEEVRIRLNILESKQDCSIIALNFLNPIWKGN